jgi:RHS repeat-associated protein
MRTLAWLFRPWSRLRSALTTASHPTRRRSWPLMALAVAAIFACTSGETGARREYDRGDPTGTPGLRRPSFPAGSIVRATERVRVDGSASVSHGGGASFTLPLSVPPGVGGLSPALSVSYTGEGNGPLGVGMSLSGLSAIVPCNRTVVTDGWAEGVDFDDDAYCLDGARLVQDLEDVIMDGLADRAMAFRTEGDTFQKIVAYWEDGGDPQPTWFTVRSRDGSERRYEPLEGLVATDIGPPGTITPGTLVNVVYPLASTKDRSGNRIEYTYAPNPDSWLDYEFSYRIDRIDYSFVGHGLTTPRRWVQFRYESRPDPIVAHSRGVTSVLRSRIDSIEMWAPNPTTTAKIWDYRFAYDQSSDTHRSLLESIEWCGKDDVCSWAKRFDYTTASAGVTHHIATASGEFDDVALQRDPATLVDWLSNPDKRFLDPTDVRLLLADLDGDGADDVLYRGRPARLQIWNVSGPDVDHTVLHPDYYQPGHLVLRRGDANDPLAFGYTATDDLQPWGWFVHLGKTRVADFDGDGTSDLLLARTHAVPLEELTEYPSHPEAPNGYWGFDEWSYGFQYAYGGRWDETPASHDSVSISGPVWLGPFNMDASESWNEAIMFDPPFQRALVDFDADGRMDQVDSFIDIDALDTQWTEWDDPALSHESFPYQAFLASSAHTLFPLDWTCGNGNTRSGDFDGDGRGDLLSADETLGAPEAASAGVYLRLHVEVDSEGAADEYGRLWGGDCGSNVPDIVLADFNGDGLDDALYPPHQHDDNPVPLVRWNRGNGFAPLEPMPVSDPAMAELLHQRVPTDRNGSRVMWDRGTRVADVNEDGRDDIIAYRIEASGCIDPNLYLGCATVGTKAILYLSFGDHLEAQLLDTWDDGAFSQAHGLTLSQVGDVTGDGAADLVNVSHGNIHVTELRWRERPDQLRFVRDDGVQFALEIFEYSRAWWGDSDASNVEENCGWPLACVRKGFPVVRRHTQFVGTRPDGSPMYRAYIHTYRDPRRDLQGRGSLGFAEHRIFDRSLGEETLYTFDNQTRVDEPSVSGGVFYPYAQREASIRTVTPLRDLPTRAELDSSSPAPGLDEIRVNVRVTEVTNHYSSHATADGWAHWVSHDSYETTESEPVAWLTEGTETPSYAGFEAAPVLRRRSGSFEYDEYANVEVDESETEGGIRSRVETTWENRTSSDRWILSLPIATRLVAHEHGQPAPRARVIRRGFDAKGRLANVRIRAAAPDGSVCTIIDPTTLEIDQEACETPLMRTDYTLDWRGNVAQERATAPDVPDARVIDYTWDDEGIFIETRTNALGHESLVFTHPAYGVPVLDMDANGVIGLHKYDGFGRPVRTERPGTPTIDISYVAWSEGDRRGMEIRSAASDGARYRVRRDELGRAAETQLLGFEGEWIVRETEYDPFGNTVRSTRPGDGSPSTEEALASFDRLGRIEEAEGPDHSITRFDHEFFESVTVDPELHVSYERKDLDDRVAEVGHRSGTAEYGEVEYFYGPFGQLTRLVDADDNETVLGYDPFGRRERLDDPDTGVTTYTYDGFGALTDETNAEGETTVYHRDVLGRLTGTSSDDGVTSIEWDDGPNAIGRIVETTSADATVRFDYDTLSRAYRETRTIDGDEFVFEREYDVKGRVSTLRYPEVPGAPRFGLQYSYDPTSGYLRRVLETSPCVGICVGKPIYTVQERNLDLSITHATYGTGADAVDLFRLHDPQTGRLEHVEAPDVDYYRTYTYDDDGLLETRVDGATGHKDTFDHDLVHRIDDWTRNQYTGPPIRRGEIPPGASYGPDDVTDYVYDEIGNLLREDRNRALVFHATYPLDEPHRLDETNLDGHFEYDDAGRQTAGGGRDLITYTDAGLPRRIDAGGSTALFGYDAFGHRVRKELDGQVTIYASPLYERRANPVGEPTHVYNVVVEGEVVAQVDHVGSSARSTLYFLKDQLGSATVVFDEDANVLESHEFAPFGQHVDATGNEIAELDPRVTIGFTGHEHDELLDLVNMGGRIYDPDQRRFLTPDPNVNEPYFGQALNRYSYVLNSPVSLTDPTGFQDAGTTNGERSDPESAVERNDSYMQQPASPIGVPRDPDGGYTVYVRGERKAPRRTPTPTPTPAPREYRFHDEIGFASHAWGQAARFGSRVSGTALQGAVDYGQSTLGAFTNNHTTIGIVRYLDGAGEFSYVIRSNGNFVPRTDLVRFGGESVLEGLKVLVPEADVASAGARGVHAERALMGVVDAEHGVWDVAATSRAGCDGCAGSMAARNLATVTPTAAENGGRTTRTLLANAEELAMSVKNNAGLRSVLRGAGTALTIGGAAFDGMSALQYFQAGEWYHAIGPYAGYLSGFAAIARVHPYVTIGLSFGSIVYRMTYAGLEWIDSGTKYCDVPGEETAEPGLGPRYWMDY